MRLKVIPIVCAVSVSFMLFLHMSIADQVPVYSQDIHRLDEPTRISLAAKYAPEIFSDDLIINIYRSADSSTKALFYGVTDKKEDSKIRYNEFEIRKRIPFFRKAIQEAAKLEVTSFRSVDTGFVSEYDFNNHHFIFGARLDAGRLRPLHFENPKKCSGTKSFANQVHCRTSFKTQHTIDKIRLAPDQAEAFVKNLKPIQRHKYVHYEIVYTLYKVQLMKCKLRRPKRDKALNKKITHLNTLDFKFKVEAIKFYSKIKQKSFFATRYGEHLPSHKKKGYRYVMYEFQPSDLLLTIDSDQLCNAYALKK